jgi:K+-transporting ATPase c subunit
MMRKRERKFVGAVLMLCFVVVYALIAMALAQARFVQQAPGPLQAVCYAILGIAWILPMLPLIAWMERPD